MPDPQLRASDSDRAAVAGALGEHMSVGRLTLAEYDERVTSAYAATTFGELAALTADLPPTGHAPTQLPSPQRAASGPTASGSACMGRHARDHSFPAWGRTSVIVLAIWLATSLSAGQTLYFWPIWVIVPWGAVLLATWITGKRDHQLRS